MAKDYYKGVTIVYKGDSTQLSAVLGQLNSDMRRSQGAARALDAALKMDPSSLVLVKDRAAQCEKQITNTKDRIQALNSALSQAQDPETIERITTESHKAEARLKALTEQLVQLNTQAAMNGGSGLGKFAADAQTAGQAWQNIGKAMSDTGDKITMGVTLPMAAFASVAVNTAKTIDTSLTDVKKTVDGTAEQYRELKEAAIEYSKTNAVTADEVLQVQSLGAQLGYAVDELEMMGRVGTGMDIATDMNAAQATTDLAQFANIMDMSHDKTENYASTIVALGNTTATTESKISDMAQRVAAAGKQVGMSEADVLGLSAALASLGINAESGGTNISRIMSNIDKAVDTNSDKLQQYASLANMTAEQFATSWKSSPIDALQSLFAGMDVVTKGGENLTVILESLGIKSNQAVDVAKRLTSGHEKLAQAVQTANTAWEENTALAEEVANRNDSIAAKMQMVQNRVTAIMEKIGAPLADAMLAAIDAAQPLFDALESGARAFSDMSEGEQRTVITTLALVAAFGPFLSITGRTVSSVGDLSSTLGKAAQFLVTFREGMSAGLSVTESMEYASSGLATALKTGLVGLGIAAAIVAISAIISKYQEWREHTELVEKATTGLTEAARQTGKAVQESAESMAEAVRSIEEIRDSTDEILKSVGDFADSIGDSMGDLAVNSAMLEQYTSTMTELSGKSSLTADELAQLKNAVDEYNNITGAAVEITNEQTGALNLNKGAIAEVTEAYMRQAEQQAYAELYKDAIKERAQAELELTRINEELAQTENDMREAMGAAYDQTGAFGPKVDQLRQSQEELSATAQALGTDIAYWGGQIADSSAEFTTLETALVAAGVTSSQYESLTEEQLAALRSAFAGTIASIAGVLGEFGISVGSAGDVAVKQAEKASDGIVETTKKHASDVSAEQTKAANDATKAQQRAFTAEENALRKHNSAYLSQMRKEHQAEQKQRRSQLDAIYKQRQKELDAEIKAEEKANSQRLKDAKQAQEDMTKAYRAETDKRLKEMEREYNAQVQRTENDGTAEIDQQIAALRKQGDAEEQARKEREQAEKKAELQAKVDSARSRRSRAEAQKELDDYLLQLQEERADRERELEIERLQEQRENLQERTDAAKDALREEYESKKEEYQTQRAEELERKQADYDQDYEILQEFLSEQIELRREENAQELEELKANHQAQLDAMSEAHQATEDSTRESLDAQLESMRDAHQEALDAMRTTGSAMEDTAEDVGEEVTRRTRKKAKEAAEEVKAGAEEAKGNLVEKIQEANTLVKKPSDDVTTTVLDSLNPLRTDMAASGEEGTKNLAGAIDRGKLDVQMAAEQVGDVQTAADKSSESEQWGIDLIYNFIMGINSMLNPLSWAVEGVAGIVVDVLGHSVAKKGPLSVGGRGESVWGEHLIQNVMQGMASKERELATQSERMARIVEGSFNPAISARYDAALNMSQKGGGRSPEWWGVSQGKTVPTINIDMHLGGLSLDSTTDIRATSRALAQYTAHEIAAKLG